VDAGAFSGGLSELYKINVVSSCIVTSALGKSDGHPLTVDYAYDGSGNLAKVSNANTRR